MLMIFIISFAWCDILENVIHRRIRYFFFIFIYTLSSSSIKISIFLYFMVCTWQALNAMGWCDFRKAWYLLLLRRRGWV